MINQITLTNLTTQKSVYLSKTIDSPFLIDSINWGTADAEHNTYSNLTGIGDIITDTKIQSRNISITGKISSMLTNKEISLKYGVSKLSEIYQKKSEEIDEYAHILSQQINPVHYIRVTSGDYHIDGKPTSSVEFSSTDSDNNEIYRKFTFSLFCEDPLFKYKTSKKTPLSGVVGGFHFPLSIKKPRGMHFGYKIPYQLMIITNMSDVSLGGDIYIKAVGPVHFPELVDVYKNLTLRIDKDLEPGEIIHIDTISRKITGKQLGEDYQSYFAYWDFSNSWFQFDIGDTVLGYSAEDGTQGNMEIWIELNESYYSLQGQ